MTRFDRNQTSLVEKIINENVKQPEIGIVDQVFEHAASDDDSNWEIDALINGKSDTVTRVPVHAPGSETIAPPKVGDKILIVFTDGESLRPVALGNGWSNTDRPPLGRAGMYRNRFESGSSPAGDGDLHITGYTSYDGTPATDDKRNLTPEETFVQISKHVEGDNVDPSTAGDIPAKIEMYDSPSTDEAWISVEINKEDGADSDATWGMKFNIKTGEWKLVGPSGFGITSDGAGNFVWEHKDITFDEVSGSTGSLSL